MLLYNLAENTSASREDCEQLFLDTVNSVLPRKLNESDVRQAHRLGRPDQEKTRPLIATLNRTSDKVAILQAREKLRDKGIGVSSDRTPRQRQRLQEERAAGNYAFYKGNKLHVTQGQRTSRVQTRSTTRAQSRGDT